MAIQHQLGARIRALRGRRGLTQSELAELVEKSGHLISLIERGLSPPKLNLLERLSDEFGFPLRDLVDFEDGDECPERAALMAKIVDIARTLPTEDLAHAADVMATFEQRHRTREEEVQQG